MDLLHVGCGGGREGQQDTKRTQQLGEGRAGVGRGRGTGKGRRGIRRKTGREGDRERKEESERGCVTKLAHEVVTLT